MCSSTVSWTSRPGNQRTWTLQSKSSTHSGSSPRTSLTFCQRSSAGSCHQTRLSTVSRGCSPTPAWMPSREPSTTCPSPLHFTGSPICRLGRGRKTNLLPDPGYVALTNICLEDGGCQDLPGHSSKNHVKIPSKICRRNLLLRCSPVSISTLKNDLFCFVRVNSVAFSAPLLRWRKKPKYRALHVTDCNSVFVAELLEIQIETINVNEERSL